ncbi:MAG: A/G-specific adenine glycosylase [Eubacterium sp.]|nr:A/G-specific adenine glycosylase [Eubacterium sp.]
MSLKTGDYKRIDHPIPPLYDKDSRVLILGSFPSVKSRETAFFYGHPQNRFWKTLAGVLSADVPVTVGEKAAFLHENHVAVWDVIKSCDIIGSSDSSIRNVVPNDLSEILEGADIRRIYCNGGKSYEYYQRYIEDKTGIKAARLPSTSPANASYSLGRLMEEWRVICGPLKAAPAGIGQVLLAWYDYNARLLPWRSDPSPYHVWISEIMLQQTRVEAVLKYYDRWMSELPEIKDLAEVEEDRLLKLWEGLGYYNRARNLKAAALDVMERYDGVLPGDYQELLSLKGIGEYTAGAIASIAFGIPVPAVDGNGLRVFSRRLGEEGEIGRQAVKRSLAHEVFRAMPKDRPGDYNQALMDLGARVCLPKGQPLCRMCPWESVCQAHKQGRETEYPVKAGKKPRRVEKKTVFVIEVVPGGTGSEDSERKIALHKRPSAGLLPDLWEFPNVEGDFSSGQAEKLARRWGLSDYRIESAGKGKHVFSHIEWQMTGFIVSVRELPEGLLEEMGWVAVSPETAARDYAIPSAFEYLKRKMRLIKG